MAQHKTAQQQAAQIVQQILGPQIASTNETYRNQGASAQAAYDAVAKMQEGVAPAITKTYDAASARQAVIAKGLDLGAQLAGAETSGASNQLLGQNNSPQQVKAADIGSILSTLGGMSASGLNREGAAFSAAAEFLPGQSRLLGVDAVKGANQAGASAVAGLNAKRPELLQGALNQILEGKRADDALAIQKWYLENTLRKTGADITGVDPVTGEPTTAAETAAAKAAEKKAKARQAAIAKRNNATADAFVEAGDWVESQLKPGTELAPKGQVPIESHKVKLGKETIVFYVKKGGGTTTKADEAETKTVYDEQLIPRKQYDQLFKGLRNRLTAQLRRYGYKPKQIAAMADDILSDYFAVVGGQASDPTKKNPGSGPESSPR